MEGSGLKRRVNILTLVSAKPFPSQSEETSATYRPFQMVLPTPRLIEQCHAVCDTIAL
jgi:hypothetical protein